MLHALYDMHAYDVRYRSVPYTFKVIVVCVCVCVCVVCLSAWCFVWVVLVGLWSACV